MFHHKTIIRESHPVLSQNYISSTNVRVVIDVVSVMAAYFDLLCVCIVHRAEIFCLSCPVHNTEHNRSEYAAITLTASITTRTLVPDMYF